MWKGNDYMWGWYILLLHLHAKRMNRIHVNWTSSFYIPLPRSPRSPPCWVMRMMKMRRTRILTYLENPIGTMTTTQRYACYNFAQTVISRLWMDNFWPQSEVIQENFDVIPLYSCLHVTFRTQASRRSPMSWQPESKANHLTNQKEIAHVSHCHYQPTASVSSHSFVSLTLLF